MQKILIYAGLILLGIGLLWPWLRKFPFGRLPGDIVIRREDFVFFMPLTSMLIVSLILTLLLWFFRR